MISKDKLKIYASGCSVLVALVILAIKIYAYFSTASMAILAGVIDSSIDVLASLSMAYAMFHAIRPPDEDHRYGHGKAEGVASLFQSVFIIGSAILLGYQSAYRFANPQEISEEILGAILTVIVLVITVALVSFQSYVIRKTQSLGVESDSLHYKGDILMNIGVIITLGTSYYMDTPFVDILFGCFISLYFLYNGVIVFRKALDILMDRELSQNMRDKVIERVLSHPQAKGIHDLKTRSTGGHMFIEFHLEMEGDLSLYEAHTITHEVEDKVREFYPDATVTVHQEPTGINDIRLDDSIEKAL